MFESFVHTIAMQGPADMSGLADLFDEQAVEPAQIIGIIAQTEGDGHARGYCALSLSLLLAERLACSVADISARIPLLMIGGTAGLMVPHMTVFGRRPARTNTTRTNTTRTDTGRDPTGRPPRALAVGTALSAPLPASDLGRIPQVEAARATVEAAMRDAGLDSPDDVVCVEIKCPNGDGSDPATGPRSRGASALGAAIALGEVSRALIDDTAILGNHALFSSRASASSGTELTDIRVIVIGNRPGAPGHLLAGRGVMRDALDLGGARDAFRDAGLPLVDGVVPAQHSHRIAAIFVNAGADSLPTCRDHRHTMRSDALAAYSGHLAKAVAHAQLAGMAGTPLILGNAGAEHQGPPGGNLVCVIARQSMGAGQ